MLVPISDVRAGTASSHRAARPPDSGARDRIAAEEQPDRVIARGRTEPPTDDAAWQAATFERRVPDHQALARDLERQAIPPMQVDRNLTDKFQLRRIQQVRAVNTSEASASARTITQPPAANTDRPHSPPSTVEWAYSSSECVVR